MSRTGANTLQDWWHLSLKVVRPVTSLSTVRATPAAVMSKRPWAISGTYMIVRLAPSSRIVFCYNAFWFCVRTCTIMLPSSPGTKGQRRSARHGRDTAHDFAALSSGGCGNSCGGW
jgi:hypothetical protein